MNFRNKHLRASISFCFSSRLLFLFGFVFFISFANGQPAANSANPRELISFDENWRFRLGDDAAAKEVAFDDSSWRNLTLPHDWSIEGPVNPPPAGDRNTGYFIKAVDAQDQ